MMWLSRYRLILILALGLVSAALLLNGHLIPAGDNATYIVLGQALVTGQGYRMISDPRLPEMALYPPGYPLLVAALLALTGTARNLLASILPLKLVSVALYLAAIGLTYDLLKRHNTALATATALLMAVNPTILHFATEVGTEIPYLFLSLGCLWLFQRFWPNPRPKAVTVLWVSVLLVLTFYVRSIALVMAVALVLHLVVRRRFAHALLLLVVVGVLVAPWFIRASLLPTTGTSVGLGRSYFALYFSSDPYGTARANLSEWIARLLQNLRIYALDIWPVALFPHALRIGNLLGPFGVIFAGLTSLLLLVGFVVEARRGSVAEWYAALFFASCAGYLWAQSRLIVPIIPIAIYYLLVAVSFLLERALKSQERVRMSALAVACTVLVLSASVVNIRSILRNLRFGLGQPVATYYAEDSEWSTYLSAMDWIAQQASPTAVVMCRKPDLLYLLTGRKALEYPYSTDGPVLARLVQDNRVAYVIEDAFRWTRTTEQYLHPALQAWRAVEPEALSLVYETDAPHARVWRVSQSK